MKKFDADGATVIKLDRRVAMILGRGGSVVALSLIMLSVVRQGLWITLALMLFLVGVALMIIPLVPRPRIRITERETQLSRRTSVPRDLVSSIVVAPMSGLLLFVDRNGTIVAKARAGRHLAALVDALAASGWPAASLPRLHEAGAPSIPQNRSPEPQG